LETVGKALQTSEAEFQRIDYVGPKRSRKMMNIVTSSQAIFHLKQAMGGENTRLLVGFGLLAKHPGLRKTYCGGMP